MDRSTLSAALELAVRAPSVHNAQPWRFVVGRDTIDLYADGSRMLPGSDPDGRDLLLSCGAALHHLRVGLTALGRQPVVHRLPTAHRPEHLATVETVPRAPSRTNLTLAVSIPRRRTDRRAYSPREVTGAYLAELTQLAAAEGALLRVVQPGNAHSMLVTACGPDFEDTGALLAVGTGADDPLSRLRAGEAMSTALLAATRLRLATCPLTEPLHAPGARELVGTQVFDGAAVPQLVLRVGWPPVTPNRFPVTRRRPLSEVVDCAAATIPTV